MFVGRRGAEATRAWLASKRKPGDEPPTPCSRASCCAGPSPLGRGFQTDEADSATSEAASPPRRGLLTSRRLPRIISQKTRLVPWLLREPEAQSCPAAPGLWARGHGLPPRSHHLRRPHPRILPPRGAAAGPARGSRLCNLPRVAQGTNGGRTRPCRTWAWARFAAPAAAGPSGPASLTLGGEV